MRFAHTMQRKCFLGCTFSMNDYQYSSPLIEVTYAETVPVRVDKKRRVSNYRLHYAKTVHKVT